MVAAFAAGHQHAAIFGVADGVRDQVAQDAFDHQRVGVAVVLVTVEAEHQAFLEGDGLEVQLDAGEQIAHGKVFGVDVHPACVDLGDVQQLARDRFLAELLGCARGAIQIARGTSGRVKTLDVPDGAADRLPRS